ncbi:hypothetical protein PENDEC_c031G02294 [Penicillium decumbens]|uniref:Uncharacterized protein n=1 Tax=Penicillium decumbens TaxID=69771 RepID=A0A1V6NVW1_PENDC|nr:hypothetical protein PENDEC_c031G02294 [Penicillium decumbens]
MSQGHPTVESDGEEQPGSESESDNMESESSLKESQYGSLEVCLRPCTRFEFPAPRPYFDRSGPYQCFYLDAYKGITWTGYTGPGVIWLKNIWKNDNATISPPFSQITQAFYERDFAINTLNHVFMTVVVNEETLGVVEKLYLDNFGRLGIQLVEESECSMMAWACGTPQFDVLLGTRLGKLAAYLVLGAFPRGSRRIVRIVVQYDWTTEFPTLRFDIR